MRLTDDLSSRKLIFLKGWLFFALGSLSLVALWIVSPEVRTLALALLACWAFARWYYFMFYVIEKYVDPGFKFAGLSDFLRYSLRRDQPKD